MYKKFVCAALAAMSFTSVFAQTYEKKTQPMEFTLNKQASGYLFLAKNTNYQSSTPATNIIFYVDYQGNTELRSLHFTSDHNNYSPAMSMGYSNGSFVFNTNSYPGVYKPVVFKASSYTFDNATSMTINCPVVCKKSFDVVSLNAQDIKTNDITVDMPNAADYVFEEGYNLKSLSEVEDYVKENKHLPGMPSAADFSKNGMSVSEMSNKLLEKVEELTLHMIQLEKENQALRNEINNMKK